MTRLPRAQPSPEPSRPVRPVAAVRPLPASPNFAYTSPTLRGRLASAPAAVRRAGDLGTIDLTRSTIDLTRSNSPSPTPPIRPAAGKFKFKRTSGARPADRSKSILDDIFGTSPSPLKALGGERSLEERCRAGASARVESPIFEDEVQGEEGGKEVVEEEVRGGGVEQEVRGGGANFSSIWGDDESSSSLPEVAMMATPGSEGDDQALVGGEEEEGEGEGDFIDLGADMDDYEAPLEELYTDGMSQFVIQQPLDRAGFDEDLEEEQLGGEEEQFGGEEEQFGGDEEQFEDWNEFEDWRGGDEARDAEEDTEEMTREVGREARDAASGVLDSQDIIEASPQKLSSRSSLRASLSSASAACSTSLAAGQAPPPSEQEYRQELAATTALIKSFNKSRSFHKNTERWMEEDESWTRREEGRLQEQVLRLFAKLPLPEVREVQAVQRRLADRREEWKRLQDERREGEWAARQLEEEDSPPFEASQEQEPSILEDTVIAPRPSFTIKRPAPPASTSSSPWLGKATTSTMGAPTSFRAAPFSMDAPFSSVGAPSPVRAPQGTQYIEDWSQAVEHAPAPTEGGKAEINLEGKFLGEARNDGSRPGDLLLHL